MGFSMGKASSRKTHAVGLRLDDNAPLSPANHPEVARAVLDTIEVYKAAAERSEILSEVIDHPGISEIFGQLGDYLRHIEKSFGQLGDQARQGLALPASMLGKTGKGSDGSAVAVGLDGIVQHSAPLDVLRSLGLATKVTRSKRVRKSTTKGENKAL